MRYFPRHRPFLATALLVGSLFAASSCQSPETDDASKTEGAMPSAVSAGIAAPTAKDIDPKPQQPTAPALSAEGLPKTGILRDAINGDLQCYLDIEDGPGRIQQVGADFTLCDSAPSFNQRVELTYKQTTINDCESFEPCGKTREVMQVSKIRFLETNAVSSSDFTVYQNANWRITVGNSNSWNGVNNTGNLSYYGCDTSGNGNCINLTGGTISCRNGECVQGWRNGDYGYSITSQMGGEESSPGNGTVRLRVVDGNSIIVDEQLKFVRHNPA